jgi:hypothetical protein
MRCFVCYVVIAHTYKPCELCPLKVLMNKAATQSNQHCGLGVQHLSVGYHALPYSRLQAASCRQGLTYPTNTNQRHREGSSPLRFIMLRTSHAHILWQL